ncbi:MAG TPA: hypothetical protein VEX37_05300, partial [Thermomicrobiales bacterium]|nr:hypothetical protein [Thermomicrobiales bacterium]
MTGTNNDRQPDLLDDFWNALRSNPATQPPSELDPSTADFVRDIERELHPSDPNARFVATLRTWLHRASPLASQADGVVTMMPPAVTTTPRAGSDTTPERPIIKRFGSVGRELLEIAAIVVVVVVVALLLRQVFRDDPNDGQLADQGTEGVGVPPGDDTLPIYQIAISAYAEDDAGKQLLLVEADGSTLVPLTQPSDVAFYVGMSSWSPDGSKVVYVGPASGGDLIVQNLMTGESYSLPGTTNATWPRWSPDGSTIAFVALNASRGHDVFVVPSSGGEPRNLTNNEAEEFIPTWSPDGSMLAFAAHDGSRSGIYVIDSDGSNLRNVSNQPVDVTGPSWSPDGTRIAFNSHPNGNADIYVTDLTTNVVSNITNSPDAELHAVWSPDGETIAYTHLASDTEGLTNLWLIDADGTNRRELIADDAYATIHAVWSPDGERLAATMQPFGQQDTVLWSLVVVNRDGSDYRVLSDRAAELDAPAWRPGTNADVILDIFAPGQSPTPTIIPSHAPTPLSEPGSAPTGELLISTRSDGEQRLLIIAVDGSQ